MTTNNDGRIPSVDEKPTKPKKEVKDRQQPTVGAHNKKKFNFAILAIVAATFLVVGFVIYNFVLTGNSAEVETINDNTAIDQAVVQKSTDTSIQNALSYKEAIAKRKKELEEKKLAQEKAEAEQKAALEAKRAEEERRAKELAEKEKKLAEETKEKKVDKEDSPPPTPQTTPITTPVPSPASSSQEEVLTPHQRRLTSEIMPILDVPDRPSEQTNNNQDNSLDSKGFALGVASTKWRHKRDLLLAHGTNIPCALRTEIISTYSGLVTCNVISDIYSANGSTLLVEKGSSVFGTQNVTLEQGQARVFVKWSDITTPQGVSIKIDSLGTGRLGAAGVGAWVDNHFKERFGSAILLSFLDDAFATLANSTSNSNNNTISTENTQEGVSDMASEALKNSINIPPTGYVAIGTRLNILVARDIDMSNVYRLVKTK